LCLLGHLAPSSHNTQPWRFFVDVDKKQIKVFIDRHYILNESDPVGRETLVSMGCCVANILLGAEHYGLRNKLALSRLSKKDCSPIKADKDRYKLAAEITFNSLEANKVQPDSYLEQIFYRQVVRAEFDPQIFLPQNIIKKLSSFTDGKKIKLHLVEKGILKQSLAEFQGQADNYVINSKVFSRELGEWLLPNNTNSYLGMPGNGFGLSDVQAKRFHMGLLGKQPLEPEDGLKFSMSGKMFLEKSPLVGLLTVQKDEPEFWLLCGIALENIFLFLLKQGFNLAIHAAIVEVGLINKIFAATLGTTRRLTALFRVGKVKNPKDLQRPFSPRLPLEEIFLSSGKF
jgi:nitroreductase